MACEFIERLNTALEQRGGALAAPNDTLADFAIFPFVRQFAAVDADWWAATPFSAVRDWLQRHLDSALFASVMRKRKPWAPGDVPEIERWRKPGDLGQAA